MKSLGNVCLTMDNRLVFVGDPLCVYDISTSSVHTIQTEYNSVDITCDVKNNIYAAFPSVGLCRIDMNNLIEGPCINTVLNVCGDYDCIKLNKDLLYTIIDNDIVLLNEKGNVVETLQCKVDPIFMCVEKRGGISISDRKSILHITESGSHNEIHIKMKTGDEITGLDVDQQGNVYACICNKENGVIVRINTATGYKDPVLENLVNQRDIAFPPTKNMFLVITDHGDECSVYQVTN